jgi:hypothetical protein
MDSIRRTAVAARLARCSAVRPGAGVFDDLLVAALHRAVALAQGQHAALAVAEDLHLDVAGGGDVLFQVDAGFLEVGAGQAVHRGVGLVQFGLGRSGACRCRRRRRCS